MEGFPSLSFLICKSGMTRSKQQKTKRPPIFKHWVSLLLSPQSVPGTTWYMFAVGALWPEHSRVRTLSHTTLAAANDEPAAGAAADTGHALSDSRLEASEGPELLRPRGALCPLRATKERRAHLYTAQCPGGDNQDSHRSQCPQGREQLKCRLLRPRQGERWEVPAALGLLGRALQAACVVLEPDPRLE